VAGILFSALLLSALYLILETVRLGPRDPGEWLETQSWKVALALNLVPYAGISFLWFMGVLRDRLGAGEHKLFATVFLGSGLLFVGLLFVAASSVGAILIMHATLPSELSRSGSFLLARSLAYHLMSVYALKMAAVFVLTASTIVLRTGIAARATAIAGFTAAAFILVGSHFLGWTFVIFPVWVFIVSVDILIREARSPPPAN
jgi:hypothetical protein